MPGDRTRASVRGEDLFLAVLALRAMAEAEYAHSSVRL
jgi:hypothetical protein